MDLIFHILEHIVFNNDFFIDIGITKPYLLIFNIFDHYSVNNELYIYIDIFRHILCHHFFHSILYCNDVIYSCSCMHQSISPSIPTLIITTIVIINIWQNNSLDITSDIDYSNIIAIIKIIIVNITFGEFI